MRRGILGVLAVVVVAAIAVWALRPLRQRAREFATDLKLINADTGDVMASATYQRFAVRREAVSAMQDALLSLATAQSTFVADSGRPTTVFLGRYAFQNDQANLGPTVEIRRDRWVATVQNTHTSMTCALTAMLDTVSGQYRAGLPVCGGWTPEESLAAIATSELQPGTPGPRVIDRVSNPGPVNNKPPRMPWVLQGVCPDGHCRFGQWTACSTIVVTRDKGNRSPVSFTLRRGEEFTALTGDVHVEQPGLLTFRNAFTTVIEKEDAGGPVITLIEFSPADTLYPLVQVADRRMVWWFRGAADTGADFWRPDPAVYRPDALRATCSCDAPERHRGSESGTRAARKAGPHMTSRSSRRQPLATVPSPVRPKKDRPLTSRRWPRPSRSHA